MLNYGAENYGRMDAELAINKAIGAATAWAETSPFNSASVFVPAGTYNLSRSLNRFAINLDGARNLKIEGEAGSVSFSRT